MKKIVIAFTASILVSLSAGAQTWSEWFRQRKTQERYLLQQIAALEIYSDYAQKGYRIAGTGIRAIRDRKQGDVNLHDRFFQALYQINPAFMTSAKVAGILWEGRKIVRAATQTVKDLSASNQFTLEERAYCKAVVAGLLRECNKAADGLFAVMTPGKTGMKDNERLGRIDRIYADMKDNSAFCALFVEEISLLHRQRRGEGAEVNYSKQLNGVR